MIHRSYCPDANFSSAQIVITDKKELHHLRDVLRLKKNDQINVFNAKGQEASATILSNDDQGVHIKILSVKEPKRNMPFITLACAVPKKGKFELIIEKATELGVDEIVPLKTQRTEGDFKKEKFMKKNQRFQTVAINAAKQSHRVTIPFIHPITNFDGALKSLSENNVLVIASLEEKHKNLLKLLQELPSPQRIAFFIGPEGDFTPREYSQSKEAGCISVSLGETILKVETAAICVLACANLFFNRE